MLWSSKRILDLKVTATDGPIGSIYDIYFDDETWSVRYFVIDTGGWLSGRRVLLSPRAVGRPEGEASGIPVFLTQAQVRNSPSYEWKKPASMRYENDLAGYDTWPDPALYPPGVGMVSAGSDLQGTQDPHLRSVRDLFGNAIRARGGEIGTTEDFIIDDAGWRIDRIVIETKSWFSGRKIEVPSSFSNKIRWAGQVICLDMSREFEHAPEDALVHH